jgi:cytochrome c oxidase assembly protein subunit 15
MMNDVDKKWVRIWYWSGAVLVFLILVVGGITRLTGSGLSIVEWQPIMGSIPPLNESEWEAAFELYKQYPEYEQVNRGMSLTDFKFIFFWEYLHRMLGRVLGLMFLVPFVWFVARKKLDAQQIRRASLLFFLGFAQAFMGWYMVKSGLVDIPQVSPFRLAAHLMLAFLIFSLCVWFAMDLRDKRVLNSAGLPEIQKWTWGLFGVVVLQVFFGALVAGNHAGHIYNTFPKMNQFWFPPEIWVREPWMLNFIFNVTTIQWTHRVLATLIGVISIVLVVRAMQLGVDGVVKRWSVGVLGLVTVQYLVGVLTLLYHVPVWIGVTHQAVAMVLVGGILGMSSEQRAASGGAVER